MISIWWLLGIGALLLGIRQLFVELEANERDKKSYPAMYQGSDWHLNEPFWMKHEHDGQVIKNPKYVGFGGQLNEEGIMLKKSKPSNLR